MNPTFSRYSMYWRVNREGLIALAGPRALLLELAHPAVAAGIAQHSNYRTDPLGRLYRTMKTMTALSFGNVEEQSRALKHFHRCHARVRGNLTDPLPDDTAGEATFDARDPQLQFWVLATLIDSVLRAYARFVTPLTYADRCSYYDDCTRLAQLLGIPADAIPRTYTAFNLYLGAMLEGSALRVTPPAREIVAALFAPTLRGRATRLFSFPGIGMLPPRLRAAYGLAWTDADTKKLEQLGALTRRLRPHLPGALALFPRAFAAEFAQKLGRPAHPRVQGV
jgi:uncharacterized protein (DUF2236 family)